MLDRHVTPLLAHRKSARTRVQRLLALHNLSRNLAIQISARPPPLAGAGTEMQPSAAIFLWALLADAIN
jgi:hypothetical protein